MSCSKALALASRAQARELEAAKARPTGAGQAQVKAHATCPGGPIILTFVIPAARRRQPCRPKPTPELTQQKSPRKMST